MKHFSRIVGPARLAPIAVVLLCCALFTSCATPIRRVFDPGTWTVCVYLCGSNLESKQSWATKALDNMCRPIIPRNANVVIQTGGALTWHDDDVANGKRFIVSKHRLQEVGDVGDVNMGQTATLADFLTFCETKYPAEHTMVVLWDHGGGPLRGACYDEVYGFDALTFDELDEALSAGIAGRGGEAYDIIGFDACLMASLEIASLLEDKADLLVASEEIEAGAGWDYAAPVRLLRRSPKPLDVARAICDGYYKKCNKRGKGDTATLSVIDLSKTSKVESALDAAIRKLQSTKESETQVLGHFAFGARYAEAFGGETKDEGRSNLVDIKGLAQGCASGAEDDGAVWNALVDAVDDAVVYQRCGAMTSDAGGISLWYPLAFDAEDLADYVACSPLTTYAMALERLFAASVGRVSFSDSGSISGEGCLQVALDPNATDQYFDFYVENRAVDGSYQDTNVRFTANWDDLTFTYDPADSAAIALNGMVLDTEVVANEQDYVELSSPVCVNGEDADLRIAWFKDEAEEDGGRYELLGIWRGISHVTGVEGRMSYGIESGSLVEARSLATDEVRGEVIVEDEIEIAQAPLLPGTYECRFVALDLMGKEYAGAVCRYEVNAEGDTSMLSVS